MNLIDSVKTCLRKFFHLQGRAGRPEYWWFFLFVLLVTAAASVLDGLIFGFAVEDQPGKHPFTMIATFVTFFPLLAAGWRRMHDTGHPGWYVLLPQLLVLGGFAVFLVTVGVFGVVLSSFDAPASTARTTNNIILLSVEILAITAVFVGSIAKLWWLTRAGDEHTNEFGNPPT